MKQFIKKSAYWIGGMLIMAFTHISMADNLSQTDFAQNYPINQVTDLIAHANNDAYQLSIPLLISAVLGNQIVYNYTLEKMTSAMQALENDPSKNSYAAWLYGRMSLAAHYMNVQNSDATTKLKSLLQNSNTQPSFFKAWALGYLGSLNKQEYADVRPAMHKLAEALTKQYKDQDKNSDLLWVWVMVAQAAANNGDVKMYDQALQQMLKITRTKSILVALQTGIPKNDFNKWASAIIYASALKMNQQETIPGIAEYLEQTFKTGDATTPDYMLAQVTYELGKHQQLIQSMKAKPKI